MKTYTNCFIKTTLCLFISLLSGFIGSTQSQEKTLSKMYFEAAVGGASNSAFASELGIQGVFKNNWVATVSYSGINLKPKNLPKDFDPGVLIIIFLPIPQETPKVDLNLISFTIGKYFRGGRDLWFTTEAGISFVNGETLSFSKNQEGSSTWVFPLFGETPPNYVYMEEKKSTIGAMLKADINWAFSSFAGLGAGVFANINSIQSPVGFQIKLIVGKMNREKNA